MATLFGMIKFIFQIGTMVNKIVHDIVESPEFQQFINRLKTYQPTIKLEINTGLLMTKIC